MGAGIGIFLISAAAGYWVLAKSSGEQGWVKTLGRLMGILIIAVSLLSIPSAFRQARTPPAPFGRPGTFSVPSGQIRRPMTPPEFPSEPSKPAAEKGSSAQ